MTTTFKPNRVQRLLLIQLRHKINGGRKLPVEMLFGQNRSSRVLAPLREKFGLKPEEVSATGGTEVPTDYFETVVGLRPCSNDHPPSLRNPTPFVTPMSQDGWRRKDSKASRKQAKEDLLRLLQQSQRQIGVPQGAVTAPLPQFPSIDRWT